MGMVKSILKKALFGQRKAKLYTGSTVLQINKRKDMKKIFKGRGTEESGLESKSLK